MPPSDRFAGKRTDHHILHDSYMSECNDAWPKCTVLHRGWNCGKTLDDMLLADDPNNIEMTGIHNGQDSGYWIGNLMRSISTQSQVFRNSMTGTVENGMLVRTWEFSVTSRSMPRLKR